ncbi:hypothetical protein CEXT_10701 [Caerostris extrusa]|uniref:Uncharacterized protein n=1 Tax=Caerostris extrusa TaxID=172846 RepID=A0AAV4VMZ0_CAEEX|nr:hypothetical protein CEXT_10701 [Caerostris extrusa]
MDHHRVPEEFLSTNDTFLSARRRQKNRVSLISRQDNIETIRWKIADNNHDLYLVFLLFRIYKGFSLIRVDSNYVVRNRIMINGVLGL